MTFQPFDRPVRAAFVGLGRIYDLNVRAYLDNPDVEVVALVDPSAERRAERQRDWPGAEVFGSVKELSASGLEVDAVEALLPVPLHVEGVIELFEQGWHVNLQKPLCNDLAERGPDARGRPGPRPGLPGHGELHLLRAAPEAEGDGGVGRAGGRARLPHEDGGQQPRRMGRAASSWEWQFQQMQHGRGILVFDDGWHKLATALWLFGPIREVRAWVGATEVVPTVEIDAPSTIVWEHENGIRGVWDITLATDMYLRSDYYTNDERWEVTGTGATPG